MGPRLGRRGNRAPRPRPSSPPKTLQWGHALGGVETRGAPGEDDADALLLQWGHALGGVETALDGVETALEALRFNGATPWEAWKPRGNSWLH